MVSMTSLPVWAQRAAGTALVAGGALGLGYLIGDGRVKWIALLIAVVGAVILVASREAALAFAIGVVIAVPTDWVTGALVGVPAARLPRLLAVLALVHVARAIYDGTARRSFVRWNLVDSAALAYFVVASIGASSLTNEVVYAWEQVVVGPVALYTMGRTLWSRGDLPRVASLAVVVTGSLLASSVLFDGVTGVAHFAHAGADYGWSDSVSAVFRPGGLIGQPVRAATLCALCLAWIPIWPLGIRRKTIIIGAAALLLGAVVVTFTRAAWLSVALFGLTYLGVWRGWRSSAFVLGAAAAAAVWIVGAYASSRAFFMAVLRPDTILYRLRLWTYAGQAAERFGTAQLLAGSGMLSSRDANASAAYALAFSGTHNAYLTAVLEHGLLGLLAYLGLIVGPALLGVRALRDGGQTRQRRAGLALIGLSLTVAVCSWSSELIRQYNVPSFYLLSVGLLVSMVLRPEDAEV